MAIHYRRLLTVLSIFSLGHNAQDWSQEKCPKYWTSYISSCYFLVRTSETRDGATQYCQNNHPGSDLISLQSYDQAKLLSDNLIRNDLTRAIWLTSGHLDDSDRWKWNDGSALSYYFWNENHIKKTSGSIVLKFSMQQFAFRFTTSESDKKYFFICEVKKKHLGNMNSIHLNRDLLGRKETKGVAPKFLKQPETIIYFPDSGLQQNVVFNCEVEGYPTPKVEWFKGKDMEKPINLAQNTGYFVINGNLHVEAEQTNQSMEFFCKATNEYGKIFSNKVDFRIANIPPFTQNRLDTYVTVGQGYSLPCRQENVDIDQRYGVNHLWMFQKRGGFVTETNRILISATGRLIFAAVLSDDIGQYACALLQSKRNRGYVGPFFSIRDDHAQERPKIKIKSFAPNISDQLVKIIPETILVGNMAILECFAYGYPTPTITWQRLDRPLSNTSLIVNYGRQLLLKNTTYADKGSYRCTATNSLGNDSRTVYLQFAVAPTFLSVLQDSFLPIGTSLELNCGVYGEPSPTVEWFHNGDPVNPFFISQEDRNNIRVDGSKLVIKQTKLDHSGVYQCKASNERGKVTQSAEVIIARIDKQMKQNPNSRVLAMHDENIVLPCLPDGVKLKSINWTKEKTGKLKTNNRYTVMPSGDLAIAEAKVQDSGIYICQSDNHITYRRTVELLVSEKIIVTTEITGNPTTLTGVNAMCRVINNKNNIAFGYQWLLDNEILPESYKMSNQRLVIPYGSRSLNGVLMCTAWSRSGHPIGLATKIAVQDVPMRPIGVKVTNISAKKVVLSWRMPLAPEGEANITSYQIETRMSLQSWIPMTPEFITSTRTVVNHAIYHPFNRNVDYQFHIFARNRIGLGQPSITNTARFSHSMEPSTYPKNLTLYLRTNSTLVASWKAFSSVEWNSDDAGRYILKWFYKTGKEHKRFSQFISNTSAHEISISQVPACTIIQVTISAQNSMGNGPSHPTITILVNKSKPSSTVQIEAQVLNSSSTLISFVSPHLRESKSCERADAIQVVLSTRSNPMNPVETIILHPSSTEMILEGLKPDMEYSIFAYYANSAAIGTPSKAVIFRTPTPPPLSHPMHLSLIDYAEYDDSHSIRLTWRVIDDTSLFDGYEVRLFHGASDVPERIPVPNKDLEKDNKDPVIILSGLKPLLHYNVEIATFGIGGYGPSTQRLPFKLGSTGFASSGTTRFRLCSSVLSVIIVLGYLS